MVPRLGGIGFAGLRLDLSNDQAGKRQLNSGMAGDLFGIQRDLHVRSGAAPSRFARVCSQAGHQYGSQVSEIGLLKRQTLGPGGMRMRGFLRRILLYLAEEVYVG